MYLFGLQFEELQFKRVVKSKVLLGAALTAVKMTHQQFNAQNSRSKTSVEIHNNSKFKCDCNMYWTRRALDSPHMPLKYIQHKMRCIEGRALSDMSPGDMLCADDEAARECAAAGLPTACACGRRPDDEPAPGRVRLRVDCTGRGLDYIPLPRTHNRSAERVYELLMAHNRIDELRADALRPDIKVSQPTFDDYVLEPLLYL